MTLYLGIAIILFLLLFFYNKEGFGGKEGIYSDNNTTAAADAIGEFNKKMATLKKTIDEFSISNLSMMDAISSINQVLLTKDNALYTSGVVENVTNIKNELSEYQHNVMKLNEAIKSIPSTVIVQFSYKNRVYPVPLGHCIDYMTNQANSISTKLNTIPSS
jgi:hypothetical protein